MVLRFNKTSMISFFTIGLMISLVLGRYIYGSMIMLLSLFVGIQLLLLNTDNTTVIKYLNMTAIPAFIMLGIIVLSSLFILYKTTTVTTTNKVITITPFMLSVFTVIILKYLKQRSELLQRDFVAFLPTLFVMIFMISTSIIPDNQLILKRTYSETREDIREL